MDPRVIAKAAKVGNVIESIIAALRPGRDGPTAKVVRIITFRSVGDSRVLTARGRIVRMAPTRARSSNTNAMVPAREHLAAIYRAFDVLEIANVAVTAACESAHHTIQASSTTDDSGFFSVDLVATDGQPWCSGWHQVRVRVANSMATNHVSVAGSAIGAPAEATVEATVEVFVPASNAALVIVSDLDDTAMDSYTTRTWRMLQTVLLRSAHRRSAVPGVPELYQALNRGTCREQLNPVCYISSGAWNLYDAVVDYLDVHALPRGAVFLNDWGSRQRTFHTVAYEHKGAHVGALFLRFPTFPFLLIGDDVHEDPELYAMLAERFSGRVPAIWIRAIRNRSKRNAELKLLGTRLKAFGTDLIVSSDSAEFEHYASVRGWITEKAQPATM